VSIEKGRSADAQRRRMNAGRRLRRSARPRRSPISAAAEVRLAAALSASCHLPGALGAVDHELQLDAPLQGGLSLEPIGNRTEELVQAVV